MLPILFRVSRGEKGLVKVDGRAAPHGATPIEEDEVNVIILSDRGVNKDFAPIPALMAVAGLHHYLIREGLRTRASLVLETGEAREVHHFSLLIGYGVSAINPYLAFETLDQMIREGMLTGIDHKSACKNFVKAAAKGVIKVVSKMGISSLQSYRGAQVFEALGLRQDVIDEYFSWTPSRIGGIGTDVIAQEVLLRHARGISGPQHAGPPHAARRRPVPVAGRGRISPLQPREHPPAAEGGTHGQLPDLPGLFGSWSTTRRRSLRRCAACSTSSRSDAIPIDEVESGRIDHAALQDRRHVVRLDQQGSARDAGHRHEPHRRQEQHRRRRRRPGALRADGQRRLEAIRRSSRWPRGASA